MYLSQPPEDRGYITSTKYIHTFLFVISLCILGSLLVSAVLLHQQNLTTHLLLIERFVSVCICRKPSSDCGYITSPEDAHSDKLLPGELSRC